MTARNSSRFFPSIASFTIPFRSIVPDRPCERLAMTARDGLCLLSLRQCLRQFDDSLARDTAVAKSVIATSNIVGAFDRPLSPNEIEDIARAFADEMRGRRRHRGHATDDRDGVASALAKATAVAARPRGRPGRKAKYKLLEAEMQRRADAGTIRPTWDEEKKALRAWMSRLPTDQRPTPKTIYNRHQELRAMYDSLVVRRNVPFSQAEPLRA